MSILRGILQLARFRAEGFATFSATPAGLLNSLAPLIAFPLVGGLAELARGGARSALVDLLATIVALLAPLIVTEFLARRWGREAQWLRFAVASNWCQWALPIMLMGIVIVLWILANLGLPLGEGAIGASLVVLIIYGISLHWFLARSGLGLSRGRAALLVLAADVSTGLLVILPRLLVGSI